MRAGLIAVAAALLLAGCGEEPSEDRTAPTADAFPVTIEHKFGQTVVEEPPKRVVAVGFNDQDFALALGVVPVGVRQFQYGIDVTRRPWAQKALNGAKPEIVGAEDLEFEKIAALKPDLILAVLSGVSERDYATLSRIAPTVAQSGEYADYGEPWQEQAEVTGRALGHAERGRELVSAVEERFDQARSEHPEFEGRSYALVSATTEQVYVFGPQDLRSRFFTDLGFKTPEPIADLVGETFSAAVSEEQLRLLDADVLVAYGTPRDLERFPLFGRLGAVREGRVLFMDEAGDFANALNFSSPLSLPFALEEAVPRLEAALDGDPATEVEPAK